MEDIIKLIRYKSIYVLKSLRLNPELTGEIIFKFHVEQGLPYQNSIKIINDFQSDRLNKIFTRAEEIANEKILNNNLGDI